jgi:hypothetical protein
MEIGMEWASVKDWFLSKVTPAEDLTDEKGYKAQRKVSLDCAKYL